MDKITKIMMLSYFVMHISCKRWDPNTQFLNEISLAQNTSSTQTKSSQTYERKDIILGQTLSEIIKIIGNDYRILGSLKTDNTNWLKIEFFNIQKGKTSPSERTELLFKNNFLVKIYRS